VVTLVHTLHCCAPGNQLNCLSLRQKEELGGGDVTQGTTDALHFLEKGFQKSVGHEASNAQATWLVTGGHSDAVGDVTPR
jgi:hypothetical protein